MWHATDFPIYFYTAVLTLKIELMIAEVVKYPGLAFLGAWGNEKDIRFF